MLLVETDLLVSSRLSHYAARRHQLMSDAWCASARFPARVTGVDTARRRHDGDLYSLVKSTLARALRLMCVQETYRGGVPVIASLACPARAFPCMSFFVPRRTHEPTEQPGNQEGDPLKRKAEGVRLIGD